MSVAIIADAHLSGPGGSPTPLLAQLGELPNQGCTHLILLGDLFHVWVGDAKYETDEVRQVLIAVDRLRECGVRVEYVEGNRDFFIANSQYAERFDRVGPEVSFESGEKRFLAVHGDGLNDRDYQYRFWRRLSKSWPSRFLMHSLPGPVARRTVAVTESGLARTNFKHKAVIPEDVIRSYAGKRHAEGFDVVIMGHFHEERRWQMDSGEVWLVDAWFRSRRVEWPTRQAEESG